MREILAGQVVYLTDVMLPNISTTHRPREREREREIERVLEARSYRSVVELIFRLVEAFAPPFPRVAP